MKYTGLNLEKEQREQSLEDYVFGSNPPVCVALVPPDERKACLPFGEVQRGRDDTMDCATRAPLNILETKFNYLLKTKQLKHESWFRKHGYIKNESFEFSDAFIAILSGTTDQGNSLKAPCHAIHEHGLIPKHMLPLDKNMTFEEYHDISRITDTMRELGKEFLSKYLVNYERVYLANFDDLLDIDILDVAGYAWTRPDSQGIYPSTEAMPNHAFMLFLKKYYIFDNYKDEYDGDFIKHLAENYGFLGYGYRLYLTENTVAENELQGIVERFLDLWTTLWKYIKNMLG